MRDHSEFHLLPPNLWLWQAFDPAVKTDLSSTAVLIGSAFFLIDPIPLAPAAFRDLLDHRQLTGILVSNANHVRASAALARACRVPVYCAVETSGEFEGVEVVRLG